MKVKTDCAGEAIQMGQSPIRTAQYLDIRIPQLFQKETGLFTGIEASGEIILH
jgi:hypothetical protein